MATQRNFATVGQNAYMILEKMSDNQRLCRLLEYSSRNPFSKEYKDLDGLDLINKRFYIVPKISNEDAEKKSSIVVQFDNFVVNSNPEFKITTLRFDIICPYSCWFLDDTSLRPYLIMNEIDSMFNGAKIAGIGTLQFSTANIFNVDENLGGYTMTYRINEFN